MCVRRGEDPGWSPPIPGSFPQRTHPGTTICAPHATRTLIMGSGQGLQLVPMFKQKQKPIKNSSRSVKEKQDAKETHIYLLASSIVETPAHELRAVRRTSYCY